LNADRNTAHTPPSGQRRRTVVLDDALAASHSTMSHGTGNHSLEGASSILQDTPSSPGSTRPRTAASLATASTGQSPGGTTISASNNISAEEIQQLEHNLLRSTPTVMRFSYDKTLRETIRSKAQLSESSRMRQKLQADVQRDIEEYKTSIAKFEKTLPDLMDRS
jgi:hypothetical protein